MTYLIRQDYLLKIQFENLDQILCDIDELRVATERASLTRIKSRLVQKYDISDEFRDTVKFSYTSTYKAKQLVYLDADAYSATSTYALNDLTIYLGNVYHCKTAITIAEAFTGSKWTLIGAQYDLFYIPTPYEPFNVYFNYTVGDLIYFKNKVYKCLVPSFVPAHQNDLQSYNTYDIPLNNYFPDDTVNGSRQWGQGVDYSFSGYWPNAVLVDFPAWANSTSYVVGDRVTFDSVIWQSFANSTGVEPGTDITKWLPVSYVAGDNRNAELVETAIYMTIYKLSPRISPRNIPDIWVKNWDESEKWLVECARGDSTLDMPLLQPRQGNSIRMGSEVKRKNTY